VAIQAFENLSEAMDIRTMRRNAERFSKERFQREFRQMVESEWEAFESRQGPLHNGWDENAGEGEG
jgi:hypothetical protein